MARKRSAPKLIVTQRWETDRRCIRGARVSEGRERGHKRISEGLQDKKTLGLVQAFNLTPVWNYAEIGISGDENREAIQHAIGMIQRHEAAWLVVTEVDRLGRDVRDIWNTIHKIHEAGGCVLVGDPLLNSADENAKIVLAVLAQLAESQRFKIGKKWHDAQQNAWESGVYPGDLPGAGYRNPTPEEITGLPSSGHPMLQIIPGEADAIRTVARRLVEDKVSWSIAAREMTELLGRGGRSTSACWSIAGIRSLFFNRTLIGEITFLGKGTIRNAHEPILDLTTFETINGKRTTSETAKLNKPKYLGAGTLRCAGCRHSLHHRTAGCGERTYYCRNAWCDSRVMKLPGEPTDVLVWQAATEAHEGIEADVFGGDSDEGRTLSDVDASLTDARARRKQLVPVLAADPSDEDVREAMGIIKSEITELENERNALASAKASLRSVFMLEELVDQMPIADRIEAVQSVLDAIFVKPDGEMFIHALGTYTEPLPRKGRQVPRSAYVPAQVRA